MKLKEIRPTVRFNAVPRVLMAALVLTLAYNSLAQAAPVAQQSFNVNISYKVSLLHIEGGRILKVRHLGLCPGEKATIAVYVLKYTNGRPMAIPGGTIQGSTSFDRIATLNPPFPTNAGIPRSYTPRFTRVLYEVTAVSPGITPIYFKATTVGEEDLYPEKTLSAGSSMFFVHVETCYEAIQSAAGNVWPIKDVCSFKRPFILHGRYTLNTSFGYQEDHDAKVMFFVPRRSNPLEEGRYAYLSEAVYIAPDGTTFSGIEFGSGAYSLDIKPQEANITLNDDYTACPVNQCAVNLQGYKILLRPLKSGQPCKGALP